MTKDSLNTYYDELGATLGETLLAPTRIYVKALRAIKDAGVTVDRRGDQSADDLARKVRLGAFQFLFDHRDKTPERLALGVREFHAGERAELQEKRHHAFGVDVDALEKIRGDDDKMGLETVVGLYLQDVLGAEDEERILFEPEFLKV